MTTATDTLVLIATYNEAENVEPMFRLLEPRGFDILFVDDNSPDGTGQRIDRLQQQSDKVHCIHRPGKLGVGGAHLDGIRWAYARGYRRLITMDGDFTHSPGSIDAFLALSDAADVVVGSRFELAESLREWALHRKLLTHMTHLMTRTLLGLPYDATGAFRLYRLDRIPEGVFGLVRDRGYSFFWESLYLLTCNGCTVRQVSIELPARTYGTSKMRLSDVVHGLTHLLSVCVRSRMFPSSVRCAVPLEEP